MIDVPSPYQIPYLGSVPASGPVAEMVALVAEFFREDARKTALWFFSPNPLLGNLAPCNLITFGREEKLLKFISQQIAENQPPDSLRCTFTALAMGAETFCTLRGDHPGHHILNVPRSE